MNAQSTIMVGVMVDKNEGDGPDVYDHRSRTGTVWWDCLVAVTLLAMALGVIVPTAWGLISIAGTQILVSRVPAAGAA